MDADEYRKHLEMIQQIKINRLYALQIIAAKKGYNTDADITMEISDLEKELFSIDIKLKKDIVYEEFTLDDVVQSMINTDKAAMFILEKLIFLVPDTYEIVATNVAIYRFAIIIMILTMITASWFTDKLAVILLFGAIPLFLYEVYYLSFIRPAERRIKNINEKAKSDLEGLN